tara:strand:+ start:1450 stop:1653 length:204 start_codon:yes stop_codon:yes gene_type:complete
MKVLHQQQQQQIVGGSLFTSIRKFYQRMLKDLEGAFGDQAATALFIPEMHNAVFARTYSKTQYGKKP